MPPVSSDVSNRTGRPAARILGVGIDTSRYGHYKAVAISAVAPAPSIGPTGAAAPSAST
jgi:hypothetical protein